jgi:hypothetical protein
MESAMRFLLAAPLALSATAALADPIYLNGLSQTDLTFTSVGGLNLEISTPGVSGTASYFNDTGVFTLGATDFIAGPLHANVFPANANESFTYQATSEMDGNPAHPDSIAGTITWARVDANGNGTIPILYGYLGLASVNGDTAFMLQFPPGGLAQVELYFPTECSVTKLVRDHCEATMEVASFQGGFVADPPPNSTDVPEPSGIGWIFALASLLPMARRFI